ncbi:hypothetical protein DH2020_022021 [Rehmannia glutinosa]|uniref:Uncharacterized protein n=1 Tax=Rehmannia glutinosa TaxID=99300 RepID=A0ABR0WF18_REHGL
MEKPQEEITFGEEDLSPGAQEGEHPTAHLIIFVAVANFYVKIVLVNIGSSMDILSYSPFRLLGFEDSSLTELTTALYDLSLQKIPILEEITLSLSLGSYPCQYNVILARPSLKSFRTIASIYHQKLKFPTSKGIGDECGDRSVARECHFTAWKEEPQAWDPELWNALTTPMEVSLLQEEDYPEESQEKENSNARKLKEEPKLEAVERIKLVVLDPTDEMNIVWLGTELEFRVEQKSLKSSEEMHKCSLGDESTTLEELSTPRVV